MDFFFFFKFVKVFGDTQKLTEMILVVGEKKKKENKKPTTTRMKHTTSVPMLYEVSRLASRKNQEQRERGDKSKKIYIRTYKLNTDDILDA